jgi:hypothetical protein
MKHEEENRLKRGKQKIIGIREDEAQGRKPTKKRKAKNHRYTRR